MFEGILIIVLWILSEIFIMPKIEPRARRNLKKNTGYGVREWSLFPVEYERHRKQQQDSYVQSIPKESIDEARYF